MTEEQLEMAKRAYVAYGEKVGFLGLPMPEFKDLPDFIKEAWSAACQEVLLFAFTLVFKEEDPAENQEEA